MRSRRRAAKGNQKKTPDFQASRFFLGRNVPVSFREKRGEKNDVPRWRETPRVGVERVIALRSKPLPILLAVRCACASVPPAHKARATSAAV